MALIRSVMFAAILGVGAFLIRSDGSGDFRSSHALRLSQIGCHRGGSFGAKTGTRSLRGVAAEG
jgi:hypothetical protein